MLSSKRARMMTSISLVKFVCDLFEWPSDSQVTDYGWQMTVTTWKSNYICLVPYLLILLRGQVASGVSLLVVFPMSPVWPGTEVSPKMGHWNQAFQAFWSCVQTAMGEPKGSFSCVSGFTLSGNNWFCFPLISNWLSPRRNRRKKIEWNVSNHLIEIIEKQCSHWG